MSKKATLLLVAAFIILGVFTANPAKISNSNATKVVVSQTTIKPMTEEPVW